MKLVVFLIFLSTFVDARHSNKIIGGTERVIQQHPYHTSVQFLGHGICAGSIISQYHILTCASCVIFEKTTLTVYATNLKVLVGTTDIFNSFGEGELFDVQHVIWHEQYEPKKFWINDIAILRLEKPIEFTQRREIIGMRIDRLYHRSILTMTNWPDDIYQTNSARYLKSISVKELSFDKCWGPFPDFFLSPTLQGCGHTIKNDDAFNMGDGGVGVVFTERIAGIASIFVPEHPRYCVFTKIYHHVEYLKNIIQNY